MGGVGYWDLYRRVAFNGETELEGALMNWREPIPPYPGTDPMTYEQQLAWSLEAQSIFESLPRYAKTKPANWPVDLEKRLAELNRLLWPPGWRWSWRLLPRPPGITHGNWLP